MVWVQWGAGAECPPRTTKMGTGPPRMGREKGRERREKDDKGKKTRERRGNGHRIRLDPGKLGTYPPNI